MNKNKTKTKKKDRLAEYFMKFMTDMGATFVDVTPQNKKQGKKVVSRENFLPTEKRIKKLK